MRNVFSGRVVGPFGISDGLLNGGPYGMNAFYIFVYFDVGINMFTHAGHDMHVDHYILRVG